MNWSRVKTFLIIIFVAINIFLLIKLIEKNTNFIDKNAINTVIQILRDKNIELLAHTPQVENSYKRILIRNEENRMSDANNKNIFIPLGDIKYPYTKINDTNIIFEKFIGKSKNILQVYDILIEFLRKTNATNIKIVGIKLGYFIDLDKYGSNLKTAEINPSWQIETEKGEKYIFDAYNAELLYEGE